VSETESLPVLSLWQPWASLVALGVKAIETRSWCAPKSMFGRTIAIHATKRNPVKLSWHPDGMMGRFTVHQDGRGEPCYLLDFDWWRGGGGYQTPIYLPLGAIVATARLVECAPMLDVFTGQPDSLLGQSPAVYVGPASLTLSHHFEVPARHIDISDQRLYGDFTPGRWAWLLSEITPVDPPVPFAGGQGFTKRWVRP
jgi:hypothetical protein